MRLRRGGLSRKARPDATSESSGPGAAPSPAEAPPRTFVGGVGYTHLRDFSVGPLVAERLAARAREEGWPERVAVGDLSYDPVKIVHWLAGEDPPYQRLVLVSAVRRGRPAGSVTAYRWDQSLPEPEQVQVRVAEAVTGVIHLDNLLVVLRQFGAAPRDIAVVEVEPEVEAMGEDLTPAVARGATRAAELARAIALGRGAPDLATSPLGGFASTNGGKHA